MRRWFPGACAAGLVFLTGALAWAQDRSYEPVVKLASEEPQKAIKAIRLADGLKVELFAAEPLLANPVAFCVDEKGNFYVAETFRHTDGVPDTRSHMNWLDDDMACRTVEDRVAMYRKYLGKDFPSYTVEHDRVRKLMDQDGDGKADASTVFADGFNDAADGIGAGLLARKGDLLFACIPHLWKLRDNDGDGKAEVKKSLQYGYGVHVNFIGHDLHGLRMGPDGRLYFSIGDRGLNVTAVDGRKLNLPDTGSVLRCEPDGSKLEVFAYGLRNPQELAFDQFGNLFTGDNNSDSGDKARWVYLVEGGDSGWRIGFQYLDKPGSRGPWNAEKLWYPEWKGQAKYIVPPIINIGDGPSGLTYDPGTGLPAKYRNHFFLCDFRGAYGQSGVRSFMMKPKGASFELVDSEQPIWSVLATDVDFGVDGSLYLSDWVDGWPKPGKGRIWKVSASAKETDPRALEVPKLLAAGMTKRTLDQLGSLLAHPDQRIRQEAQFELADRARDNDGALNILKTVSGAKNPLLARIHAIWGLGQIARNNERPFETLTALAADADPEIRAQSAKVLGDADFARVFPVGKVDRIKALGKLLADASPRVRFFAAVAFGKMAGFKDEVLPKTDVAPLLAMIRENADADTYLRHAGVMGLVHLGDKDAILAASKDASPSVRLAALLAMRRLEMPEVAGLLSGVDKADPESLLETARAIYDTPIPAAMTALAALPIKPGYPDPLTRRVLAANARVGGEAGARFLVELAGRSDVAESVRAEALQALGEWSKPAGRDRIVGMWRPIESRPAAEAAAALKPALDVLLRSAPEAVRRAAIDAAGSLGIKEATAALIAVFSNKDGSADTRVEALQALDQLQATELADAVHKALTDSDYRLRTEALGLLAKLEPAQAIRSIALVLDKGTTREKQRGLRLLGGLKPPEADQLLATWLDRLNGRKLPATLELDLVEAAEAKASPAVKERLAKYRAEADQLGPIGAYRGALEGGDSRKGREIFENNAAVYCVRCHKVRDRGGEVGPELNGIANRKNRQYLLEAIVEPNKEIAQGFESVVLALNDGRTLTGVLRGEDANELKLITAEGRPLVVKKSEIDERSRGPSAMPADLVKKLSKTEIRDLVEFLSGLR